MVEGTTAMTIVRLTPRRVAILPLFVWVCLMPGCLPVDISEVRFRLLIEPDLSGVLEVTAVDVHPLNTTGESVEAAKRVCSSEYEEFGRDFLDDASLEDLVLKATPTGAATCDVTATGRLFLDDLEFSGVTFDYDGDGAIGPNDFAAFATAIAGPEQPYVDPAHLIFDFEADGSFVATR